MCHMELTTVLLLILIAFREFLSFRERSQMLDRLMAKSLPEYKEETKPEENQIEQEKPDTTIPIEDAESDLVEEVHDGEE